MTMGIKTFFYQTSMLALVLASGSIVSPVAFAAPLVAQDPETETEVEAVPAEEPAEEMDMMEAAPAPAAPDAGAAARGDVPLYERPTYIGQCRSSGATLLTVYEDSSLTRPIDDIDPYTRITLTGVLGTGVAQVEEPLGWVRAATLLLNCNASGDPDPDPVGACFRVVPTSGLIAREAPGGTAQTYQGQIDGPAGNSRVYGTVPPQRQTVSPHIWQRVYYTSLSGNERLGWVAEARGTQRNLVACPGS
jgi:hypothetical protein